MLQLQFHGAAGTVTGSKYILKTGEKKYLIDCGLFQGLKVLRLRNWHGLTFNPAELDAVLLTHAHIDHSGMLPLLAKQGFRKKIYATSATHALCELLLPDAAYLQEEDASFANKHGFSKHKPALPLYTVEDAKACLKYFQDIEWDKHVTLDDKTQVQFKRAGHILGASFLQIQTHGKTITFSGDLGRQNSILMHPPQAPDHTDYLVVESTYGNRTHSPVNPMDSMRTLINATIKRGGILLIPAFAVGRAQELLYLIQKLKEEKSIPDVPVFLNSPMAIESTNILSRFPSETKITAQECHNMTRHVRFINSAEDSRWLNTQSTPSIIISASGMATGGRVLHHLKTLLPDARNTVLLAGFQAAGTRGESLLHGSAQLKIHGAYVDVKAQIAHLDTLSAHADANGILDWLKTFKKAPRKTFITHGEPLASEALRKRIQDELGWDCTVPDHLDNAEL